MNINELDNNNEIAQKQKKLENLLNAQDLNLPEVLDLAIVAIESKKNDYTLQDSIAKLSSKLNLNGDQAIVYDAPELVLNNAIQTISNNQESIAALAIKKENAAIIESIVAIAQKAEINFTEAAIDFLTSLRQELILEDKQRLLYCWMLSVAYKCGLLGLEKEEQNKNLFEFSLELLQEKYLTQETINAICDRLLMIIED